MMIFKLIPLIILVVLVYIAYRSLKNKQPKERKSALIKYGVYALIAVLMFAVITGRIHWLGAVVAAGLGLLKFGASTLVRLMPFLAVLKRNNVFGNPVFKTPYIEVTFDIQTGALSGKIVQGEYSERPLHSLTDNDFETIENEFQNTDKRSYYLLKIARSRLGSSSQKFNDFDTNNTSGLADPSYEEAVLILGLYSGFTHKDVNKAHKQLIQKLHPDRGGNDYLAARVNIARDILIKHLDKGN